MSDYPMLISNKLHSFRNFRLQKYKKRLLFVSDQPFRFVAVISFLLKREYILVHYLVVYRRIYKLLTIFFAK